MKRHTALLLALLLASVAAPARTVYPLDEGWSFFFRHENSSDNARIVSLPHTWDGAGAPLRTAATYQRELFVPAEWQGKRLFVKFHGVQHTADLFVNGRHAGEHRGGGTAFVFEITRLVRCGGTNALRMEVSNGWQSDVLPTSSEADLHGGIYRPAELIVTDRTAISPLYLGSDGVLIHPRSVSAERVEGEAEIHLTTPFTGGTCTLALEIAAPDGTPVYARTQRARLDGKPVRMPFAFGRPELWSPESPVRYTVTASVAHENARDTVRVRTGFRDIRVSSDEGFLLNGRRIAVRGVALGHDHPATGGACFAEQYDDDLRFMRELGANAVRSSVMPHEGRFYDLCDSTGMLAWVELPLCRAPFLSDIAYFATQRFEENGRSQLREMIAQLQNHPSVVVWGIFSGLLARGDDVLPYVRSLDAAARTMDPSRPTAACSDQDGAINFVTDLIVWRQNVGWERGTTDDVKVWSDLLRRNWSHLRSAVCYGAQGMPGHRADDAAQTPRANWLPESRQTRFHEAYARTLERDTLFWGIWIDQLFDYGAARRPYGMNASGLVTFDRKVKKDAFYLYKALWNRSEPTLHLTDKRRTLRREAQQHFGIYATEQPLLLIDGDTVRVHEWAPCHYLSDTVTLRDGRRRIEVRAGALADGMVLTVASGEAPPKPSGLPRIGDPRPTN